MKAKELRKLLKRTHQLIAAIFFQLDTRQELPDTSAYSVKIYFVADPEDWASEKVRADIMESCDQVVAIFAGCPGVDVDHEVVPADEIDLHTVARSLRFEELDFLTVRDEEEVE